MNKKGFTLVELLAVIVILAIIAIITIPMIKGVIDKVKMKSLEDSVYGLKNAAELYYSSNEKVETTEFICNGSVCTSSSNKKISFKGKANGRVKLFSDGKISICIEDENYSSLLLAENKKPSTTLGTCDFTMEDYNVVELVSATLYRKNEARLNSIVNKLYDVKLISDKSDETEVLTNEIETNYNNALNSSSYDIYVDGEKSISYPLGSYNVEITCDGAEGRWNNVYKSVMIGNITKENIKCNINFTTCTTDVCDTSDESWINWTGMLGYDYKQYKNFNDFLSKEVSINSCSDINLFYDNTNGAYDYLTSQDSLVSEINQRVDFSKCSADFAYKGSTEEYDILVDGIYKLEVYGAKGGNAGGGYNGGNGGYSSGYKHFINGTKLYISVGGQGGTLSSYRSSLGGGWNGGGNCRSAEDTYEGAGGGASHIATKSGVLSSLSLYKESVIIVAGGGGGGHYHTNNSGYRGYGGTGGGTNGGASSGNGSNSGGTQTTGYSFGQGANGASVSSATAAGGGGGWYGGTVTYHTAGAGGSGYIGGVPIFTSHNVEYKPLTTNGVQSGNGKAKITFVGIK